MQTQKIITSCTEKQQKFIENLQKRGFLGEVDFDALTKRDASAVIDIGLALAKEKALSDEAHSESEVDPEDGPTGSEEINQVRLGLCIKLVFNKHEHNVANPQGASKFKAEVKQLYKLLVDLEREFQNSPSSARNGGD